MIAGELATDARRKPAVHGRRHTTHLDLDHAARFSRPRAPNGMMIGVLLERDQVLAAAAGVLDEAVAARAGSLVVIGEAGLGKTAVLEWARARAAADGFTVGWASGSAMESSLPFGVGIQMLESLGGDAALEPALGPAERDAPEARGSAFYSALRWLAGLDGSPVLLAVDDLHWADPDSLALLSFLARRLPPGVALVATARPFPPSAHEMARELAHDGYAQVERLAPLTEHGAGDLLSDRIGHRLDDAAVARAWTLCSGNPLLLEQVARAVEGGEEIPESVAGTDVTDALLLTRFAGLSPTGMRCAQAAAVLGTQFRVEVALELSQLSDAEADEAVDALARTGLVRDAPEGGVEFVHPLFRQALYEDVAAPARKRLHARAFDVLKRRGLEQEAAEHAIRADLAGDRDAVELLARVGRTALRRGALETAITLLEKAEELAGAQAGPEVLLNLAEALVSGGRSAEAISVYERVLERADLSDMTRAHALRMLARGLQYVGNHEAAMLRFDQAVALAEPTSPDFAVHTLVSQAFASWFAVGPTAALQVTNRAREIAERCDAPARRRADAAWALCALETGDPEGLDIAAAAAHAVLRDPTSVAVEARATWGVLTTYGSAAKYCERLPDADRCFRTALDAAHEAGSIENETALAAGYVDVLTRRLRLREALSVTERCAELADVVPLAMPFAGVARAMVYLFLGRLDESEAWAERVEPIVAGVGAWSASLWLLYTRGWRRLTEGRVVDACRLYGEMEAMTARVGVGEPCEVPWAVHAVAAYVAAGREDDAGRVIEWLDRASERLPCHWLRIASATGRARIAELHGDHDSAEEYFESALALHEGADLALERFQTLFEYGRSLRRAGQVRRARPLLADAVEIAENAGAEWLARQAREELRIAGGRRRRRGRDPGRLTPQEERVAALAATGARTRDIADQLVVSPSTVETHLEHIYAKLGIHSRRELMALRRVVAGEDAKK